MDVDTPTDAGLRRRSWRKIFFGLQTRLTALVLGLTLSAGVLVGGLLVDVAGQFTNRQKRDQCLQLSSLLAKSAGSLIQHGDIYALDSLAEHFVNNDSVLFVAFTDLSGNPLVSSGLADVEPRDIPKILRPTGDAGILGAPVYVDKSPVLGPHLAVTYPVTASADSGHSGHRPLLGYVHVGLNVQRTLRDLAAVFDFFSGVSIIFLMITVPLAYLVVRCMVVPLNELSRVVRRFAEGDLSARSGVRRRDEIGELASSFNAMADELGRKHNEIVSLNTDLEERVNRRTRQLRELAARDPLTGLYNRRHFSEVLDSRYSEAVRYGTDLSCMMLDLDDFKRVNDEFGHHTGDELLILASITIASQLRAADVAARFGGDELIILLPQTDAERAQVLGERISAKFAQDLAEQMPQVRVSLSIGIASLAEVAAGSAEDLIKAADQGLYRAKATGKSRIVTVGSSAA